jgi:hypothetical protein
MAAATRSRPRESVIHVTVDRRPTRTRHPDTIAIQAGVKLATVLVLLVEGPERVEEGQAALVEHALLDHLVRPRLGGSRRASGETSLRRIGKLVFYEDSATVRSLLRQGA